MGNRELPAGEYAMERSSLAYAEQYSGYARDQLRHLLTKVRVHFEPVFGHVVTETLVPDLEVGFENATEAFEHYRDAVRERDDRIAGLQSDLAVALRLLRVGAIETADRFTKGRRPPPEWVGQALGMTRGPQAQEPF